MNKLRNALSVVIMLITLFVVNSVSANDELPASTAYAPPAMDCHFGISVQTGWLFSWIGSFGLSTALRSDDCKASIAMQMLKWQADELYQQAVKAYKVGDIPLYVELLQQSGNFDLQANVLMRSTWIVEESRRDYIPTPARASQTVIANKPIDVGITAYFAYDKATITPEYDSKLETFAKSIKGKDHDIIMVDGHTDERGSYSYNENLGMRRAKATKSALIGHGIEESKIYIVSYSEGYPAETAHNESAWKQNRRASVSTTIYSYKTLFTPAETQAHAKAKYDEYTSEVYLNDYEAKLKQVEEKYDPMRVLTKYEEEESLWPLHEAKKHVRGAKVRILFAQFREKENKLVSDLTLDEAIYWSNALHDGGEDIVTSEIANHFNLEFSEGEFVTEDEAARWSP